MGRIYSGAPPRLLRLLRHHCGLTTLVETGTYAGGTASMASLIFDAVYSIEKSAALHAQAAHEYRSLANVRFVHGDSVAALPDVIQGLAAPAVFWLDAHWCGQESTGEDDPCPVLDEIAAINRSPHEHVVLIDDAHAFMSPLERPYRDELYPAIGPLLQAIDAAPYPRYTVIIEDVIISVPWPAKSAIAKYCRDINFEIFKRIYG